MRVQVLAEKGGLCVSRHRLLKVLKKQLPLNDGVGVSNSAAKIYEIIKTNKSM